jgi:glycosidase
MLKKHLFWTVLGLFFCTHLTAQLTCSPIFPGPDDNITITYNPQQGDRGLASWTGDLYAHTGVITNLSTSLTNWKYVKNTTWCVPLAATKFTRQANGTYTLTINNIRNFYGVPASEQIQKIAMVVNNGTSNNCQSGRSANGADMYYDVVLPSAPLKILLLDPTATNQAVQRGATMPFKGAASLNATLTLTDNGVTIASATNAKELSHTIVAPNVQGAHRMVFKAVAGTNSDSAVFNYVVVEPSVNAPQPAGTELGANFNTKGDTVTFVLHAPRKMAAYVIGDFNNWTADARYKMKHGLDSMTFWLTLGGFTPNQIVRYQYLVDSIQTVADPLSTLVLDPNNDIRITPETYPNMPAYPTGKTKGYVSVIQPGKPAYNWKVPKFNRPAQKDLVIYELLVRDFVDKRNYQTLIDTLKYLKNLGINAIELMPVHEFDNNDSWGYNPTFHMALDKYYGTADKFKEFIDVCHENGIAVITDMVFNHVWGGGTPLTALYFEGTDPAFDNPWLNRSAKHPANVGFDMNHESPLTRLYTERNIRYWLKEFNLDGFRWDLSKGFTQKFSGDFNTWAQYDADRVRIWKNYHDVMQAAVPGTYNILEHFGDNTEETELADYGMLFWANANHNYRQAAKGNTDNSLLWSSAKDRGWLDTARHNKHIAYMESHDEERLTFDCLLNGQSTFDYNIKNLPIALRRHELAASFYFTVPGPRMIWQFGELGYDITINQGGRTSNKPILWDYFTQPDRKRLYNVYRNLIALRKNEVFRGVQYNHLGLGAGQLKKFQLNGADMLVNVLGNFSLTTQQITPSFQQTGKWYDYMTGDSITVTNVDAQIRLLAGEYRIYTTKRLGVPPAGYIRFTTATQEFAEQVNDFLLFPNPSVSGKVTLGFNLKKGGKTTWEVLNLQGQRVAASPVEIDLAAGSHANELITKDLSSGLYIVKLTVNGASATQKLFVE